MSAEYLFTPSTPEAVRERVLRHATAMHPGISIALLRQSWTYDALPALREIKAPIRAVNGDKFPTNVEVNRRHMPGFQAMIVTGTGHYPMLEDPVRLQDQPSQATGQNPPPPQKTKTKIPNVRIALIGSKQRWTAEPASAFLTGNTLAWQIRYEDNDRTIVGYKELAGPRPGPGPFDDDTFPRSPSSWKWG